MDRDKVTHAANNRDVLLFVNGPYQFIVGLACVRKTIPDATSLDVIGYDMRWQRMLGDTTGGFARLLDVPYRTMPLEFKKSDPDYSKTYRLRSLWNQFNVKRLAEKHPAAHVFAPKLFNNPERAIADGAKNKALYIYDDGIGLYLERIITFSPNKYARRLKLKGRPPVIHVCPSAPALYTQSLPPGFKVLRDDYTKEIEEIIGELSNTINIGLADKAVNKNSVILCFSRISILQSQDTYESITKVIDELSECSPDIHFYVKPHPRDDPQEVKEYFRQIGQKRNCEIFEPALWMMPVEVLTKKIRPKAIVAGASTIAINQKFFPHVKIIISGVLGERRDDLSVKAVQFLENTGLYAGDSVDLLIDLLKGEFCSSSFKGR